MPRRFLPLLALPAWLAFAVSSACSQSPPTRPIPALTLYKVLRVVDGDTVILKMDGKTVRARLIGVDTPETVQPGKPVERFGGEASNFLKALVEGKTVSVEYEAGPSHLDKYGRLFVYLYLEPGHLFVNREIIAKGYGHAYVEYPFRHMEDFRAAERVAREGQLGLWSPQPDPEVTTSIPAPTPPPLHTSRPRKQTVLRPSPADTPVSIPNFSSSPYSSSRGGSSVCGASTKKGGSCRRLVRGGGYCYQHC